MKNIKFYRILFCCMVLILASGEFIVAQNFGEFEGPVEINFNGSFGTPQLSLVEDQTSSGASTRLGFLQSGSTDQFEIRSFTSSVDQRIGFSYNNIMRVAWNETNSGFGIGTDLPDAKLHVTGNSTSSFPTLKLNETTADDFSRLFFTNTNAPTDKWSVSARLKGPSGTTSDVIGWYYNGSPRLVYDEDLNALGIGTGSPTEKLHVEVAGNDGIKIQGSGTGDARLWINNTAGSHFLFDDFSDSNAFKISSSNDFAINTNGSERLRILETGEVGINAAANSAYQVNLSATSKPFALESLNNTAGDATSIRARVTAGTGARYGLFGWVQNTNTGDAYGVYGTAETGPANSWALYANGDFWYAGSLKAPSDIRLKQNIEDLPSVLDRVLLLETKTYEYNKNVYEGLNLASGTQVGFIAQDVQKHFPSLVEESSHSIPTENEAGETIYEQASILGLSSIEMIPILTKAIQEQQELIKEHLTLINELRIEVDILKSEK